MLSCWIHIADSANTVPNCWCRPRIHYPPSAAWYSCRSADFYRRSTKATAWYILSKTNEDTNQIIINLCRVRKNYLNYPGSKCTSFDVKIILFDVQVTSFDVRITCACYLDIRANLEFGNFILRFNDIKDIRMPCIRYDKDDFFFLTVCTLVSFSFSSVADDSFSRVICVTKTYQRVNDYVRIDKCVLHYSRSKKMSKSRVHFCTSLSFDALYQMSDLSSGLSDIGRKPKPNDCKRNVIGKFQQVKNVNSHYFCVL